MKKTQKINSKDVGLEIGLIIEKHFFNTEHLHYGYWTDELPVTLRNLPLAQQKYCDHIISHIPPSVKSILDVGCGVGKLSSQLQSSGNQVDGVSVSAVFTERVQYLLGSSSELFQSKFEDMTTDKKYDLILFSESFQYINMEKGLEQCKKFLKNPGYILICDFFETEVVGEKVMGGGHHLTEFYKIIEQQPFQNLIDLDITQNTAPTLEVVSHVLENVGKPVWELIFGYLESNYRITAKILKWKFRRKIEKINRKYFSGDLNAKNFSIFKTYRLLLYKTV